VEARLRGACALRRDGESDPLAIDAAAVRSRAERGEALVSHLRRLDWPLVERGRSLYVAR